MDFEFSSAKKKKNLKPSEEFNKEILAQNTISLPERSSHRISYYDKKPCSLHKNCFVKNSKIQKFKMSRELSNKQRHTLDYWRVATKEIENTCLSVLHLLYKNNDYENYLKYQNQFRNFKDIRSVLSEIVLRTVETNNLFLMESMVVDSVKQLKNMIALKPSVNQFSLGKSTAFERTVSRLYNEIAFIIIECMLLLKNKLNDIGLVEFLSIHIIMYVP